MAAKKRARRKRTKADTGIRPEVPTRVSTTRIKSEVNQAIARQRRLDAMKRQSALARAALELDYVDGKILELLTDHPTATHQQMAEILGLRRQTVTDRINASKFQRVIQEASRSAVEIFASNKAYAARRLRGLMDAADLNIATRACIAHMWPEIHKGEIRTGEDFASFIQEAFERSAAAKGETKAAKGETKTAGGASTRPVSATKDA